MNKKLFLGMFAAATMLFATSCQNDELDAVQAGNEATVSFTLGVEGGVQTRAISDGENAKQLTYQVFDEDGNTVGTLAKVTETVTAYPHTVKLTLAKGQTYKVAFWAQNPEASEIYDLSAFPSVTVDYGGINNDETRDAFFKTEKITVTRNENINVVLKRPFAQLNLGVYTGDENKSGEIDGTEINQDWEYAVASGIEIKTSKVVINNAATSIDLVTGNVDGKTTITYDFGDIPTQWLEVETDATKEGKEHYKYLSMSYLLVNTNGENGEIGDGASKDNLEGLEFTFRPEKGGDIVLTQGLNNVPIQRNWRTNIIGKFLTGDIQFNISIDPIYDGDHNIVDETESTNEIATGVTYSVDADGKETFSLINIDGLKWFANQSNTTNRHAKVKSNEYGIFAGQTIKLANSIDLNNEAWTPISSTWANRFAGTFDGASNTISNLKTTVDGAAGLFGFVVNGSVENLTITNADVTGTIYAGAIAGQMYTATAKNCNVEDSEVLATGAWGRTGAIAGHVTDCMISGNSVKNTKVTSYSQVGGLVGTTAKENGEVKLENNALDNVDVVCNRLKSAAGTAFAGELVGQKAATPIEIGNTLNNVNVIILKADAEGVIEVGTAAEWSNLISNTAISGDRGSLLVGKTVKLTNDLDFSKTVASYPQVYLDAATNFTFDGNGHTIRKFSHANSDRAAFFRKLGNNFTIKNVTFEDAHIYSAHGDVHGKNSAVVLGIVEGYNGIIKDVTVKDSKLNIGYGVGAFIGSMRCIGGAPIEVKLENCNVKNTEIKGSFRVGGLVGYKDATSILTITNCSIDEKTTFVRPDIPFTAGGNSWVTNYQEIEVSVNGTKMKFTYAYRENDGYYATEGKFFTTEGDAVNADNINLKSYAVNE